jgi:hypothetical protein
MVNLLRFVDSIASSPGVRLNLNDGATWSMGQGTDFGIPPMRRQLSSTLIRDGDYVGATAYGNREINLALDLYPAANGGTPDNVAAQIQALQRELDRPNNILQYTPNGATNTVFFRTFRASPDSVRYDPGRKAVAVTVMAEPFALGLREDITAFTINNNPASGSNGLFANLTGIKGDVETPLFIEYADGAAGLRRAGYAIGVRTGAAPYPNLFQQAENMSPAFDTSIVADGTMSNGSKTRTTFAGLPGLALRLSANFPASTDPAGAENWGTFRVFARVAQTVATDTITMSVLIGGGSLNQTVTLTPKTQPQLVDLGTLDSTSGLPTVGGYGNEYRIADQAAIFVYAGRTAGTGNLDIDYLVFVPADECFGAWAAFDDVLNTTDLGVIDGVNDAVYVAEVITGATPGRHGLRTTTFSGSLPRVPPGNSRLVIVETTQSQASPPTSNLLTSQVSMTCRYWPRYLLVRPVGT